MCIRDRSEVAGLRATLTELLTGRSVRRGAERIEATEEAALGPRLGAARAALLRAVAEELAEFRQDRLIMAGAATLARREHDFRGSIHPLLEAIEEQVTLLRLMNEMRVDEQGLAASIGTENAAFGLGEASIVASDYLTHGGSARVGVMGPTRMDYQSNLAAARAVARYLSRLLEDDETGR